MSNIFDGRNISLLTDLYELLMMNGYIDGCNKKAIFDVFYRKNPYNNAFSVFCGLSEIIDYIQNIKFDDSDIEYLREKNIFDEKFLTYLKNFKFTGSIYAYEEGSIITANEPVIKVIAPIVEAQLIESALLSIFNHECVIATKAYRVCKAADGKDVMEFGLRRAQSFDASIFGAKACVIGGCVGTSNVLAGKLFDIPILGTHAHSWVMLFDNEYDAFYEFAMRYKDMCILLVDTYDTLNSGIPNAIKVFKKMREENIKLTKYGIRLDSGDLAYLSFKAREMLDKEGFNDAIICASNDLDEDVIISLANQGAKIDLYGVGTKLITGDKSPTLGSVYKLSAIYDKNNQLVYKIKISDNVDKISNPGNKEVYRIYDKKYNKVICDLITINDEQIDFNGDLHLNHQKNLWDNLIIKQGTYYVKKLFLPIIIDGKLVYKKHSVKEIKQYFSNELNTIRRDSKRLINPKELNAYLSDELFNIKNDLIVKRKK